MNVLGIESSCDETGIALYHTERGLLAHALHTQMAMHAEYGGVVPELASRDHIRRLVPLLRETLSQAALSLADVDAIAYTQGPGLAGALLVGAAFAEALAAARGLPTIPVHHLEGHLLSPLLSRQPPTFPFVALLVSGGHTQLMAVHAVGDYRLLGDTLDDAAGEAFDKTAKLLGLPYPGGAALSDLATAGQAGAHPLPRPMLRSGDLDFSFSGLKTAVLHRVRDQTPLSAGARADLACEFQQAMIDVLSNKAAAAMRQTGLNRLVVAGGVGANRALRARLDALAVQNEFAVHYPEFEFCTDNGAMIALAGALRLQARQSGLSQAGVADTIATSPPLQPTGVFAVRPRWPLAEL